MLAQWLGGGTAVVIASMMLVHFEGTRFDTYLDTAGVPTICHGHTETAKQVRTRSAAECKELLAGDLGKALATVKGSVKVPIKPVMEAALGSFTYNVGGPAFEKSTLLRLLNQGKYEAACHQMSRWVCESTSPGKGDKTGPCHTAQLNKRKNKGLVNRREMEVALCLKGI